VSTRAHVAAIERLGVVRGARLADGRRVAARNVVIAADPGTAAALLEEGHATALTDWARTRVPVRAATFDVALRRLPRPRRTFALGLERPLYLSVHSAVADLAPHGSALIHTAAYLGSRSARDPQAAESELRGLLDLIQPGWRDEVVQARFVPDLTVSNGLATAADRRAATRIGPEVAEVPGLYVAGDWVGSEGMLLDASLASAARAADAIVARTRLVAAA
jgi:phytoene dehydrogenase-like protein